MSVRYREPDDDPEGTASFVLIALITFLVIVIPCLCLSKLR